MSYRIVLAAADRHNDAHLFDLFILFRIVFLKGESRCRDVWVGATRRASIAGEMPFEQKERLYCSSIPAHVSFL